ncbi:Alpha/Beta hydrolase protein [Mucidula mucida]|nr:Alpha/Beta hydrolase protein [Mucidula mucida]
MRGLALLLSVVAGAFAPQIPLDYADLHLSSLQSENFIAVSHSKYPAHGLRIKKSNFCDPTVNVYTGYLDVDYGAKHLFFYFFESRASPEQDDVMMWINGGPGGSSALGLFVELGPCTIDMNFDSVNGTTWNPYSWTEAANVFFLDQPVGVGFSYADYGETIETTEDAAKNIHAFITIFFETFQQFSGRKLHLAGESYGGRYLPVFASEIYDQNTIAKAEGRPVINLDSVIIGNGLTDISTLYEGRYQIECSTAALNIPFQSITRSAMQASCIDQFDSINCRAAVNFCEDELSTGMLASGRNIYDISKPCIGTLSLGIPATFSGNFTSASSVVNAAFSAHMDQWRVPNQYYVASLLDRGVRVLIYAGTYDWVCNWVANRLWVEKLEWERGGEWRGTEEGWREWNVDDGGKAGVS